MGKYADEVAMNTKYVRNRYFPKLSNKRCQDHDAWSTVPEAPDEAALADIMSQQCTCMEVDATGLAHAHVSEDAKFSRNDVAMDLGLPAPNVVACRGDDCNQGSSVPRRIRQRCKLVSIASMKHVTL